MAHVSVSSARMLTFIAAWIFCLACTNAQAPFGTFQGLCGSNARKLWPAPDCNQYIECRNSIPSFKSCPRGLNFNVKKLVCDRSVCNGKRGFWRQIMPSSGNIAIHCTLVPYTSLVVVWHRGIATWDGRKPEPGMAQPGNTKFEKLSAVIDPVLRKYTGYDVGPSFCAGHTPLPNGQILSCGGEYAGMSDRNKKADKEDGIDKCRLLTCKGVTSDTCNWQTVGVLAAPRWYVGQVVFPALNAQRGPFVMLQGGSVVAGDPDTSSDVPKIIEWVWPLAKIGPKFKVSPDTQFTTKMLDMNLYPVVHLMPWKVNNKYVLFQWAVNYGELVTIDDPDKVKQPVTVLKVVPAIKPALAVTYPAGSCPALHAYEYPWGKTVKLTFFGGQQGTFKNFAALRKLNANSLATNMAYTIDLAAPTLTWTGERMPDNALMRTCIPLPNGKILLFHGVRKGRETSVPDGAGCSREQVYNTWIYDPKAPAGKRWLVDPTIEPHYRAYHSCGLLMPDGSLFGSGGDTDPVPPEFGGECDGPSRYYYEIDSYLPTDQFRAVLTNTQPKIISYPKIMKYNGVYNITYTGLVDECSLVTPGANTHVMEQSSKVVFLQTIANFPAGASTTPRQTTTTTPTNTPKLTTSNSASTNTTNTTANNTTMNTANPTVSNSTTNTTNTTSNGVNPTVSGTSAGLAAAPPATGTIVVKTPGDPIIMLQGAQMLFCMYKRGVYSTAVWITLT